jgi:phosphate acetyltransferase
LGTELPGPGTIYVSQSLAFHRPILAGDTVAAAVRVKEKRPDTKHVIRDCECRNQVGEIVIEGVAEVVAPDRKVRCPRRLASAARQHEQGRHYRWLMERARVFPPIATAVVHPCDGVSLISAIEARDAGLIVPVLGSDHEPGSWQQRPWRSWHWRASRSSTRRTAMLPPTRR